MAVAVVSIEEVENGHLDRTGSLLQSVGSALLGAPFLFSRPSQWLPACLPKATDDLFSSFRSTEASCKYLSVAAFSCDFFFFVLPPRSRRTTASWFTPDTRKLSQGM